MWKERYPEVVAQRYGNSTGKVVDHIDHCLNSIRESLMCNADLTPNVWSFNEELNVSQVRFDVQHTCKDWSKLKAWAEENKASVEFTDDHDTHGAVGPPHHGHD